MRNQNNRPLFSMALVALTLVLTACGRDNKVYPDPIASDDSGRVHVIDGRNSLPLGFFDQSVNQASVEVNLDGTNDTSVAFRFITWDILNNHQAFNGGGLGNRAMLGLSRYSGQKLADFESISFDSRIFAGTQEIEALLVIDLTCDSNDRRVLIASSDSLATDATPAGHGYVRSHAGANESKWQVLGASLTDPGNPAVTLVPTASGLLTSDLNALKAAYPEACIRNGVSFDDEMPIHLPVSGVLLALGRDNIVEYSGAHINRIEINLSGGSDLYDTLEWSAQ